MSVVSSEQKMNHYFDDFDDFIDYIKELVNLRQKSLTRLAPVASVIKLFTVVITSLSA